MAMPNGFSPVGAMAPTATSVPFAWIAYAARPLDAFEFALTNVYALAYTKRPVGSTTIPLAETATSAPTGVSAPAAELIAYAWSVRAPT